MLYMRLDTMNTTCIDRSVNCNFTFTGQEENCQWFNTLVHLFPFYFQTNQLVFSSFEQLPVPMELGRLVSDPVMDRESLSQLFIVSTVDSMMVCPLQRSDCLALDLEKPKPKFVKEVLEKSMRYESGIHMFSTSLNLNFPSLSLSLSEYRSSFLNKVFLYLSCRLSYHQRIVDIVPATFSALIPAEPIFIYKYDDESACKNT